MTPGGQRPMSRDHPRSRGVYLMPYGAPSAAEGSSPLARGLHQSGRAGRGRLGIIPARAGFTDVTGLPLVQARDHPRSRGVYATTSTTVVMPLGSSPLARGLPAARSPPASPAGIIPARAGFTVPCNCQLHTRSWIIPARAGFTHAELGHDQRQQDHPRSRGVYVLNATGSPEPVGSSPLARGLQY